MPRIALICFFVMATGLRTFAQVVTTLPYFVTENDSVTVIFDATLGNAALKNLGPPDVYAHTGVITSKSTSSADWRYVQGNWGKADAKMKMQYLGSNKYQIRYHIRSFYGVPVDEKIYKMAFVFRNLDGSKVGRSSDGSDIFVELFENQTYIRFTKPSENDLLLEQSQALELNLTASDSGWIRLFQNGVAIDSLAGTELNYTQATPATGDHVFIASLQTATDMVYDTVYITVNGAVDVQSIPIAAPDGIHYIDSATILLTLYAPNKKYVHVIGDFNDWKLKTSYAMKNTPDGKRWWYILSGLTPGQSYGMQYLVDGNIRIADPYSTLVLDPFNDGSIPTSTFPNIHPYPVGKTRNVVSLLEPGKPAFAWQEFAYTKPNADKLNIYELHIRDFLAARNYNTLQDTLQYFKRLGINAIELMPVNEFEGNNSWGYNTSFHMALDKYYGTPDAFKSFIQECHRNGIAVIQDVVFNHAFSQNSLCQLYWDEVNFRPTADNPWLNPTARHDFNVGYDFNHESVATQAYMDRILKYWLEEFQIDGFRFDLSKGFTQKNTLGNIGAWGNYDQSRIDLLKRMKQQIVNTHPDTYLILEHFADNNEEQALAAEGFMVWGNLNHDFIEASMGYAGNFNGLSYKNRGFSGPKVVGYMESHDEERMMYKNLNFGATDGAYNIKQLNTALKRAALSSVLFFGVPGPKMIWQFGEIGYDYSIDYNTRLGEKPLKWDYLNQQERRNLFEVYANMLYLRNQYGIFHTTDFSMNTGSAMKDIKLNDNNQHVLILGNFNTKSQSGTPVFQKTGIWYEYFSGDSLVVTNTNMSLTLAAGEYRIYSTEKLKRLEPLFPVSVASVSKVWMVYPNPCEDRLFVALSEDGPIEDIRMTTLSGQTWSVQWESTNSGMAEVSFAPETPAGIYVIRILSDGQWFTHRLVKTQ